MRVVSVQCRTRPRRRREFRTALRVAACAMVLAACTGAAPPASASREVARGARFALRELDRFLDHHPLIEDDLRRHPARVESAAYLDTTPELREFLASHPAALPALARDPRHFLHRALLRQADTPIRRADVAELDPLLANDPALEFALREEPARVHDADFLRTHPTLRDFLTEHPAFARAFPTPPVVANHP